MNNYLPSVFSTRGKSKKKDEFMQIYLTFYFKTKIIVYCIEEYQKDQTYVFIQILLLMFRI